MVKKEIDAGIISQLGDNKVAFLPYVDRGDNREVVGQEDELLSCWAS